MRRPRLRTLLSLIAAVGVMVIAFLIVSRRDDIVKSTASHPVHPLEQKTEHLVEQKETFLSQDGGQREREEPSINVSAFEEDGREVRSKDDGDLPVHMISPKVRPSPLESGRDETAVLEEQDWELHEEDAGDDDSMAEADTQEYSLRLPAGEEYI